MQYENMIGRRVRTRRILADKPQMSNVPGYGYILADAKRDPEKRESCKGVGQLTSWKFGDVVVVSFITPNWVGDPNGKQTCAFAHIDDIEPTDSAYVFPDNEGLVMQ